MASEDDKEKSERDLHPEHGLLPPPPSFSAPSLATTSYNCCDEDQEHTHPNYGPLPTCAKTADDLVFTTPQSLIWMNSSGLESSSESELGGQTLFGSIPTATFSDSVLPSLSTSTSLVCDSISNAEDESVAVAKLEARVRHLTTELETAFNTIEKQSDLIHKLKTKLRKHEDNISEEEVEEVFKLSKSSSNSEVDRPRDLKFGPGQHVRTSRTHAHYRVHTTSSISPSSGAGSMYGDRRGQHSGGGESVAYNNFINYSRNTTPNPSVSTV